VVRRPSALLIGFFGAALALMLIAPSLPDVGGTGDVNTILSDAPLLVLLAGCALSLIGLRDDLAALCLITFGSGLIAAAMNESGSIPASNISKVLFAAALGMLLARVLAEPAVVIAVPLFVAGIDIASVAGGPTELLSRDSSKTGEFVSIYLPAWGGGRAGVIGVADFVFLAFFASCAWRFGLRRRATTLALVLAPAVALCVQVLAGRTIAVLPFLSGALLLVNIDRLPALMRAQRARV
jgi:hypothetical protein